MITIRELLKDPHYKEFFCTVPVIPDHYNREDNKPWRLIIQLKGERHWRTKRYKTYREAFKAFRKVLPKVNDATINSPALDFQPPLKVVRVRGQFFTSAKGKKTQKTKSVFWKPTLPINEHEEHNWCPYCRRPSVFDRMDSHPLLSTRTLGGVGIDPSLFRCTICGASEILVNLNKPQLHQRWDKNAAR